MELSKALKIFQQLPWLRSVIGNMRFRVLDDESIKYRLNGIAVCDKIARLDFDSTNFGEVPIQLPEVLGGGTITASRNFLVKYTYSNSTTPGVDFVCMNGTTQRDTIRQAIEGIYRTNALWDRLGTRILGTVVQLTYKFPKFGTVISYYEAYPFPEDFDISKV